MQAWCGAHRAPACKSRQGHRGGGWNCCSRHQEDTLNWCLLWGLRGNVSCLGREEYVPRAPQKGGGGGSLCFYPAVANMLGTQLRGTLCDSPSQLRALLPPNGTPWDGGSPL